LSQAIATRPAAARRGGKARRVVLAALLGVGLPSAAPAPSPAETACSAAEAAARVAAVEDARSLRLEDGRVVRPAGIEPFTLLLEDPGYAEQKLVRRLSELTSGTDLRVAFVSETPDRYRRLPALVSIAGSLLQERLAGEGLALAFAGGDALPCFDRVLAAEAEARRAHRGFWSEVSVPEAEPEALKSRIGRFAIFEGTVVSVGTRRATTYLDFGTTWSKDVTIEIVAKDRDAFGGEAALDKLAGSRIRARGFLQEKAGPMLVVRSPLQLEILSYRRGADRIAP
jgi:endonuclease YncB( thermonuclease family)